MANELPEVVPNVESMPTTGWFCQTSGNARRRTTKNSSSLQSGAQDIEGIYDVAGVPGHTHNANAVISVDADYSAYRQRALNVLPRVWGYDALDLPVGLLTDSVEPDHAAERYERAIERCVGTMSLFPENCTGHIEEPTRSIGEIRTLVAPKARLDTLTYTEERRGWRLPKDADDVLETSERDELVSDFPDVYIDVRPLTQVQVATLNLDVSPGSLYMETPTFRYRVVSAGDGLGTIGTLADGTAWDGTLRFVWDDDSRTYKTLAAVSVTLNDVREVALADGAQGAPIYDTVIGANPADGHAHRLTVTFPVLETSKAFDGFCWLGNLQNEEALNYASRQSGLALAPRIPVEVTGVLAHIGPFHWIGMPAYRIPVGGLHAHPASDILQETLGNGTHTDLQYNHWDKFDAFRRDITDGGDLFDGILRYQWRQAEAERLHAAAPGAVATSRRAPETFDFAARSGHRNGGIFFKRAGGILGQVAAQHYATQPNFNAVQVQQYAESFAAVDLFNARLQTRGTRQSLRSKDAINAAATGVVAAAPIVYAIPNPAGGADIPAPPGTTSDTVHATSTFAHTTQVGSAYTLQSATGFTFDAAATVEYAGIIDALTPFISDKFCAVPMTPLFYQLNAGGLVGDFSGDDLYLGKIVGGARRYVPNVICNCTAIAGNELQIRYDLSDVMHTVRGYRVIGGNASIEDHTGSNADSHFFIRGWTNWLHPQDGVKSNFDLAAGNLPANAQTMRNQFKAQFTTGNKFVVPAAQWRVDDLGDGTASLSLNDWVFALSSTDYSGIYFETAANTAAGRKLAFFTVGTGQGGVERLQNFIGYEAAGGVGTAFQHGRFWTHHTRCYVWDQAANNNVLRAATHAEIDAESAQDMNMYILGPDWYRTHVINDPYAAVRADSNRLGAVFQSVKRISQHVCAPVLNPNLRIGASAPLNHDTRHLPPELRDFRLQLQDIDWGRLQTDRVSLNELTLYEFRGGTQKVGAEQNIMYLPQFREFKQPVDKNEFKITCFSELGSPSYFCFFCRSATTDILQQPLIKTLSIYNETTAKKSNSVQELTIGQLFHLTQRNVHPAAEYSRAAYNRRQTVLLSAEDVGLMGLKAHEYQKAKRVEYTFSGTCDRAGEFFVVLVYNNRGLHIDGRRLQVVTLHE